MAYLGVDIGGTKTLIAVFNDDGTITEDIKFPTPKEYSDFLKELSGNLTKLKTKEFVASTVAVPGRLNRATGVEIALGNLPWKNTAIKDDLEKIIGSTVEIENDANLGGLSEAKLLKNEYNKVLYITISTGIGGGIIINGIIDPDFAGCEPGGMIFEHDGVRQKWENFASGKAVLKKYGKLASEIEDPMIWQAIAADLSLGFLASMALIEPEIIIVGGGVGAHLDKFGAFLTDEIKKFVNPVVTLPAIIKAVRPESAVVYGCYEYAKARYGQPAREINS